MDMLTTRQGTLLQIQVLTDKGLQFKLGWLSVTTVKRKVILLDSALNQKGPRTLYENEDTIVPAQAYQEIPTPAAFQTDDLDAFDSNCDDVPSAKAVLMSNLSSYDSNVLLECSEQPFVDNDTEIDITSDSNIISYEQYLQETKNLVVQNTSSSAQQYALLMSVIEEMSCEVAKCNKVQQENIVVYETLTVELERYKEQVIVDKNAKVAYFEKLIHSLKRQLNATVESHKTLSTTVEYLKKEFNKKEDKYLDEVIDLQKKNKALDNVVYKMGQSKQTMYMLTKPQTFYDETHKTTLGYQNPFYLSQARWKVPALYDGNTIVKTHVALFVTDSEETLELAEHNMLKILAKQNDPSLKEKKVNIASIDYVALNKLSEHFVKHFVPQKQLSAKHACWLPISQPVVVKPSVPSEPVLKKEIPRELPSIRVSSSTEASRSKPRSNTRKDRISQNSSSNKKINKVEAHPRIAKSSLNNMNRVSKIACNENVKHSVLNANSELVMLPVMNYMESRFAQSKKKQMWKPIGKVYTKVGYIWKPTVWTFTIVENMIPLTWIISTNVVPPRKSISTTPVIQIVLWYLDSGCSKHMTGQRSQLINFVSKFLGTVRFRNDQIAKIMGYGDYQLGNVTISRVYYVEGLEHTFFSVDGDDLLSGSRDINLYNISLDDMLKSSLLHMDLCGPMHVESINGKTYILVIVDDYSRFTWVKFLRSKDEAPEAEVVNTACYTQNRSLIRFRYKKTPYELICDKKPDLSYLYVFGSLCYPTNDNEDLGKLKAMASKQFSSGFTHQLMTLGSLGSGLVPNPIPQQPYVPPTKNDWDILFQPMFDEFFNPPLSVVSPFPIAASPRPVDTTGSTVSTSIDKDAPSTSNPSTQEQEQSLIIFQGVEESPKTPHFHDDLLHETLHEDSTSQGSSSNVRPSHTPLDLLGKWTENHPIANLIRDPSQPVSTRKQLKTYAMWCYFDAFLTSVEPKNFKEAMLESSWINAMQEEIHEFERLQV
ncbi:retrovirus-related pol polyprotein from transposon TNT 1-94 [Tanacetum coccineum]